MKCIQKSRIGREYISRVKSKVQSLKMSLLFSNIISIFDAKRLNFCLSLKLFK